MTTLEIVFWASVFIVFYTYIGYGIVLYILVKIKERFEKPVNYPIPTDKTLPEVTLFITAYNEEDSVDGKMENCLALDYPIEKLHILWVTDGSNDNTNRFLSDWPQATVLYQPERQGKTAAINRGMKFVKTPYIVFTDANAHLSKESVRKIIYAFADAKVGCVAGEKRLYRFGRNNATADGESLYWKYESTLKALDARLRSTVGAAGELFAVRLRLFEEMRTDTLLDDFIQSMRIAMLGYTIAYCAEAYAVEFGSANLKEEAKRKVRIAAGGLQSIWRLRSLLNPFRYGWLNFQYVSHRVLRWTITPVLFFLLFPLSIALSLTAANAVPYLIIYTLLFLLYVMGLLGWFCYMERIKSKILFIPFYFFFMNICVIKGFFYFCKRRKKNDGTWEKSRRAG
ncbi:glycosyltransferase family 2 protein [Bacteroides sp. UBA939]|uniref:glycosyltransferase family 2 protein n=1 Tax=Bacteroides sp. UBA939 TaxID=1946092 RepID=UPI0025BED4AE|nr:glycosyltransferase family 2 protein [Bacteroides sp. UBA939]